MCVIVWPPLHQQECALTAKNVGIHTICTHTKNTHTFLVTAPHLTSPRRCAPYPMTTQKTPLPFGGGADIVADNINYFSTLLACSMYALFASLAALFASRFTFK